MYRSTILISSISLVSSISAPCSETFCGASDGYLIRPSRAPEWRTAREEGARSRERAGKSTDCVGVVLSCTWEWYHGDRRVSHEQLSSPVALACWLVSSLAATAPKTDCRYFRIRPWMMDHHHHQCGSPYSTYADLHNAQTQKLSDLESQAWGPWRRRCLWMMPCGWARPFPREPSSPEP